MPRPPPSHMRGAVEGEENATPHRLSAGEHTVLPRDGLPALLETLRGLGYTLVGPTVREGAIVHAEIGRYPGG